MAEKEYIERGKVHICLDDLSSENLIGNDNDTFISLPEAHDRIDDILPADVAEVVRCKDCKHSYFLSHCSKYECGRLPDTLFFSNDFCSYGERKTDD